MNPWLNCEPEDANAQAPSVEEEAVARIRWVAWVSLPAEMILAAVVVAFFPRPDWLTIEVQSIWFVCSVALLAATLHPGFGRIWKPTGLLYSLALLVSAGILSLKGAMLAPFMFLIALLPAAGTVLPWEPAWQGGLNAITVLFGVFFSSQFDWPNQLVISGLCAMIVSILGSHLVTAGLTRQRGRISTYLQALALSEEKFRKIFETSPSLIAIHSLPEGSIVDVNPPWEKTFGYNRSEAVGRSPAELGLTVDRTTFVDWLSAPKMGDAGVEQVPTVFLGRGENKVHCDYSWTTLRLNGRDCVLVVGHDVSARVLAEDELRRNRQVLVNQERLKAVGELASGIAHDLNNSLNALRLRIELLCADSALFSRHSDALQLISRIIRDAASTIGRLQDFARRRHDRPVESVNLNAVISESVDIAKSTLEEKNFLSNRSIRVEVEAPALPFVLGDPGELRQIFLNLLLNAQDAMPVGGTIRITGRRESEAIVIRVEDEGQGIPPEHLSRIFDPFFSTKGERGTGLGLSIAYGAMARIGGSICAANRPNGGAVFTLSFPLAYAVPIGAAQQASTKLQPRRVLVTDDDIPNLQALSDLVESKGHTVIRASSGPEALEILLNSDSQIDMVFCDLGMPLVNGWQIAQQAKSLKAPPTFYLVTGWGAEIPGDDPRRRLVDGVIAKPVDPKILDQFLSANPKITSASCEPTTKEKNGLADSN
jgi:PAS domain S-box-containing protein